MNKKRKQQEEEEHIDETWLVPYGDMLTLLLALFIVLFAGNISDEDSFQQFQDSFNDGFLTGGDTVISDTSTSSSDIPLQTDSFSLDENLTQWVEEEQGERGWSEEEVDDAMRELEDLGHLQEEFDGYIEGEGLEETLETSLTEEGLLIMVSDYALFDSGSATVKTEGVGLAEELSEILYTDIQREVMVLGHTDNIPISNEEFRSNWDLSVMRAVNFLKILLDNESHDPTLFSSIGYGEFRPIASNDTLEGRSSNRRVEVLILPQYSDEFLGEYYQDRYSEVSEE